MADLVFEATQEADGGYCAECLTENIFAQADTWDELRRNVVDATTSFFSTKRSLNEFVFTWCGMKSFRWREAAA